VWRTHAEQTLRRLLGVADDYAVLFLQGGASTQFSSVPLNLLGDRRGADYVNTGEWSKKAIEEGRRYGEVNVVASSKDTNFATIPPQQQWQLGPEAAYLHYTPNETIGGVEFFWTPQVVCRWWRICLPPSCHVRLRLRILASFTQAPRKISAPPASPW
jgi:phosphoserine aminotransferase